MYVQVAPPSFEYSKVATRPVVPGLVAIEPTSKSTLWKTLSSGKIIGVLGCLAQQEGEEIFERAPWVSLVCGSASYRRLPELLAELEAGGRRVMGLDLDTEETFETEITRRDNPFRAYLTIIEGCDYSCAYCVVPHTRGPERSRSSESITARKSSTLSNRRLLSSAL